MQAWTLDSKLSEQLEIPKKRLLPVRLATTLRVGHGESPKERTGFSRGLPGGHHGALSPHGDPHVGRGGPRGACNYLSMANARWGRPSGNLVGTTWKKKDVL